MRQMKVWNSIQEMARDEPFPCSETILETLMPLLLARAALNGGFLRYPEYRSNGPRRAHPNPYHHI